MATSSVVPTFKAALVTALQARAGLSGVQVARRWPGPSTADEGIYLGDARGRTTPRALKTGRQRRTETAQVEIIIQTLRSAHTPLDADDSEDRAFALLAELEGALADDPDVSSSIEWTDELAYVEETIPLERGWATRLTVTVSLNARLL